MGIETLLTKFPKDLKELLSALDRALNETRECAANTKDGINNHSFSSYHRYRDVIDQYSALEATIRSRKGRLSRDPANELEAFLLKNERIFLTITVQASLEFFFALSAISFLPLGTKELFARELEFLHTARIRLSAEEHQGNLSADLEGDIETAELILVEIMDKAPTLLNLESLALSHHPVLLAKN